MRLIDTETLQLATFTAGGEIPEYAILSHTWANEELSYQDWSSINNGQGSTLTKRMGYFKIIDTCHRARQNGLKYAWVDTCCIDKTSSAELSESINSMFQWYQDAKICYVLLSDFELGKHSLNNDLKDCRWFTRGWCLQELIAPKHVDFYDVSWTCVGTRFELRALISDITGIPQTELRSPSALSEYPIARKMSWAAGRQTTRAEDSAYCLLGIFNVNMPLLYGEGAKAFLRLQEEIMRQTNDMSIFACGTGVAPANSRSGFRSMLARSADEFEACSTLRASDRWHRVLDSGKAFNSTNNGLYFRRLELEVDARRGVFHMPLNCAVKDKPNIRVHLHQIGPGRYVRLRGDLPVPYYYENPNHSIKVDDAYIVGRLDDDASQGELMRHDSYDFQVLSSTHDLSRAIQFREGRTTADFWNPALMSFKSSEQLPVYACWIVYPSLAIPVNHQNVDAAVLPRGAFYIIAAVWEAGKRFSRVLRTWLSGYSSDQWSALENDWGALNVVDMLVKRAMRDPSDSFSYEFALRGRTAMASISSTDNQIFNIAMNFCAPGQTIPFADA